jgi:hypothetical protein
MITETIASLAIRNGINGSINSHWASSTRLNATCVKHLSPRPPTFGRHAQAHNAEQLVDEPSVAEDGDS